MQTDSYGGGVPYRSPLLLRLCWAFNDCTTQDDTTHRDDLDKATVKDVYKTNRDCAVP